MPATTATIGRLMKCGKAERDRLRKAFRKSVSQSSTKAMAIDKDAR